MVAVPLPGFGRAGAAPLGTVRLSQASGTIDATPIFARATASRPCPAGYGRNALVRVGRPGGPYTNLARPLSAGGYDRAAVTAQPNRSFATALGGVPPGDGVWLVVVECYSETLGQHPERFTTAISVSGRSWRLAPATAARPDPSAPPGGAPDATTGPSTDPVSAGPATPGAADPSADPRLAAGSRTGSASPLAGIWWIAGLVGVLFLMGIGWLATRPARATRAQRTRPPGASRAQRTRPPRAG